MQLKVLDSLPPQFMELNHDQLFEHLGGPTLIRLEGRKRNPMFISTLLHGNETTGFYAVKDFFVKTNYLKRDLIILIGNPEAAAQNLRHLDHQKDFNRIWDVSGHTGAEEEKMAAQVLDIVKESNPWASVDIHNNTGKNPLYGCVNRLNEDYLRLAGFFDQKVVYFNEPHQVMSNAMANFCPSVTLECGVSGDDVVVRTVRKYLQKVLDHDEISDLPENSLIQNVYKTFARIKFPENLTIDFEGERESINQLSLRPDVENLNFIPLNEGERLGFLRDPKSFLVLDDNDNNITDEYFEIVESELRVKKTVIPSMFTRDIRVACTDSFGYLMTWVSLKEN